LLALAAFKEQQKDYEESLVGLAEGSTAYAAALSACHARGARRCLSVAETNRGLYVKAAQFLASIRGGSGDSGIPREYVDALAGLTEHAPHRPASELAAVLGEVMSLGGWPQSELDDSCSLRSIEIEPLASASVAQVHRARLPGGVEVAVKVQHAELRSEVAADLATLRQLGTSLKELSGGYDLMWIVDDFERNMACELDFQREADNAEATAAAMAHLAPQVHVPKVFRALSSKRVLTVEHCDGLLKADDPEALRAAGLDPEECGELICDSFAQMIFLQGRVHADPHAGNVYIRAQGDAGAGRKKPQLVILDHGLYHDLRGGHGPQNGSLRQQFCQYWEACCSRDTATVQALGRQLAGKLCRLLPIMLSPWFLLACPDASFGDVFAAAQGKMPEWVHLREVLEFVSAAHDCQRALVGLLHSLGYIRGLLQNLAFPEGRRLACMWKYATLGNHASPPLVPQELSTGQRMRLRWHLGVMECQLGAAAPFAGAAVRWAASARCAPCCASGEGRGGGGGGGGESARLPGVTLTNGDEAPLSKPPAAQGAAAPASPDDEPPVSTDRVCAAAAPVAAAAAAEDVQRPPAEEVAAGVPPPEATPLAAPSDGVDSAEAPAAVSKKVSGANDASEQEGVMGSAESSRASANAPKAGGRDGERPPAKKAAGKAKSAAAPKKKTEERAQGSGEAPKTEASTDAPRQNKEAPKFKPTPKLTKQEAAQLLDRGIQVLEEKANTKKLTAAVKKCKASNSDPSRQQAAMMSEVLPMAQEMLGGVLESFGFGKEKLTLAMFQVSMHAIGDAKMQGKINRMTGILGIDL